MVGIGFEREIGAGEAAAVIALGEHGDLARQRGWCCAQGGHQRPVLAARGGEQQWRIRAAHLLHRGDPGECGAEGGIVAQAISQIEHRSGLGMIHRPGLRAQRRQTRAEFACGHCHGEAGRAAILAGGGGQQRHAAPGNRGLINRRLGGGQTLRPRSRSGPAVINGDQQGAGALIRTGLAQHRPGKRDDHQGRGGQSQREQPERGACGGLAGGNKAAQQPDGREILPLRRGRGDFQQPPQHRQQRQRQQHGGLGEAPAEQKIDQRRPLRSGAMAAARLNRAVVAGESVAWV